MVAIPPLEALPDDAFARLREHAEVLEQDSNGLKVLRLADGSMLKLFRVKRLFSSAQLYPYSRHFCRNAARLAGIGVPTVAVQARYRLTRPGLTAVRYRPLPGETLRRLARAQGFEAPLIDTLGAFVAHLHRRGVYFRSLHLGNIVLTPEGRLGLIDVADLSIFPWPMPLRRRLRNFRHLCRGQEDRELLGWAGWQQFCRAYAAACGADAASRARLVGHAEKIFKSYTRR